MRLPTLLLLALPLSCGALRCAAAGLPPHPVFEQPVHPRDDAFREHPFTLHSQTTVVIRATFQQEKTLQALRHPLRSNGHFLFSRNHGASWLTTEPFTNLVVITRRWIGQADSQGRIRRINAARHPAIRSLSQVLIPMLSMDPTELDEHFEVFLVNADPAWTMALLPRDAAIREVMHAVVMEGIGATLQQVTLHEQHGDRTRLTFTFGEDANEPLTSEEEARFRSR